VVGLDEGAFPASDRTARRSAARGPDRDIAPRDRDRAAFLDVLLCARDALYLSYVATEARVASRSAPSSVVLELADALARISCAFEQGGARRAHRALPAAPPRG